MKFEVYCDESRQDTFFKPGRDEFLLIGSLWLPADKRTDIKERIRATCDANSGTGEIKWKKVSQANISLYKQLLDLFVSYESELRFRCIAVPANRVDFIRYHDNDKELGFYKFYYQLLHHWILDFNSYRFFCDIKTNRRRDQLATLQRCLVLSNLSSKVISVQALPSHELVLIQLTDILLGAVSSRLNRSVQHDGAKDQIIKHLERALNVRELKGTPRSEEKFNIFQMHLDGGW